MSAQQTEVSSFDAVVGLQPKVLILGSMPGIRSLNATQYYAHPQNAFWWLMESILGISSELPYEQRLSRLAERGVALWDVLQHCRREGSLDSSIERSGQVRNNIANLLKTKPSIRHIVLNGKSVALLFRRHFKAEEWPVQIHVMPSTSPANARMTKEEKREQWKIIKAFLVN